MEGCLGTGNINRFVCVAGGSDTTHSEFFAESSHVVKVNGIGPAFVLEFLKDRLRHFLQRQQKVIHIHACIVLNGKLRKYRRFVNMILLRQNSVEQSRDFAAGGDLHWLRPFRAKAQFRADPQAVFVVCQSLTVRI